MSKPAVTLKDLKADPELNRSDIEGFEKNTSISHIEEPFEDGQLPVVHISDAENKRLRRKIHA
jgi:hypothetical protein